MTQNNDKNTDMMIYQTEDGQTRIDVCLEEETVWLTQAAMAELFQTTPQNITMHITSIYKEGELDKSATCKDYLQVRGIDYDSNADITLEFFATVQNKLHYAVHGHTAAELITQRANADKPNMGLTSWQGEKVRKTDVAIAKNYLSESELKSLNRIITMYLDYAEDQAERHIPMTMNEWKEKLDAFLKFNRRDILNNPGKVSAGVAKQLAEEEYEKFRVNRMAVETKQPDEFDKVIKKIKAKKWS